MSPSQRLVEAHLGSARFRTGAADGRWRLVRLAWPYAVFAIAAAPRNGSPDEYFIRFELSGYPEIPPTGGIWDEENDVSLPEARRPKGERAAQLFRMTGWVGESTAMYAPWDRLGLQCHPEWANQYPKSTWNATRDLTFVLTEIWETLNADDYAGA